jgi:hypothetical protein
MSDKTKYGFAVWASLPLAVLLGAVSLGGILLPSVYARETASWAAQGLGQDWVDLLVVAPALIVAGVLALRGSVIARLALGGMYAYTLYSFLIYAFAMHFNALFLLYCAVLGLSCFAMVAYAASLAREDVRGWFAPRAPVRLAGVFLIVLSVLFAGMWLAEDIPALLSGTPPPSLAEVGLITNPVHVLDLSIVLPALAVAGVALLRRRTLGYVLAPMMLGFSAYMSLAIGGMLLSLFRQGLSANLSLSIVFAAVAVACAGVLGLMVRGIRPSGTVHAGA